MSDSAFDVAWRAFAEADARVKAPARVRLAVMAAWDAANQERAQTRSARNYFIPAGAALTAAAVLVAIGLARRGGHPRSERAAVVETFVARETPSATISNQHAGTVPRGISPHAAQGVMHPVRVAGAARVERSVPMVRLTADPAFETESLQIVRLRVPRASLDVFGVALLEPEASVLVDVDVVVGDDGLPRDIRRIRRVVGADDRP
jgi:hypothetical protein